MNFWDVAIVGAGPAGILAAEHLEAQGLRVLLLDGGGRPGPDGGPPALDEAAWRYETAGTPCDWLRVRAVGGASLAWGGWCNRFPEIVFRDGGWPYDAGTLEPHYDAVERRLNVVSEPIPGRYQRLGETLGIEVAARRVSRIDGRAWTGVQSLTVARVRAATVVVGLDYRGRRVRALEVIGPDGRSESIPARAFLIAASPVETARLLLASDLGARCSRIGEGLTYHPMVGYALIESGTATAADPGAAFVPRFVNVGAKSRRPYPGGFSVELNGPFIAGDLAAELQGRLTTGAPLPANARVTFIHAMGEATACPRRRVDLSPSGTDSLGRPVPRIHLAWTEDDQAMVSDMNEVCVAIAENMADNGGELVHYLDPVAAPILFHEAGTCAMGPAAIGAPCDPWGRVRALDNVWVADASALPSAGDRHPTLTILAHALRAAGSAGRWLEAG